MKANAVNTKIVPRRTNSNINPKPKPKRKPPAMKIKQTTKSESDKEVIGMAAEGLGHLCFWDIKGHYKPELLRQKAIEFSLPKYVRIPDRDPRSCLSAACRKFRYVDDEGKPIKAEIVFDDDFGYTVGLLKRDKPEERKAKWEQVDSVYLLTVNGTYKFSDSGSTLYADAYVKLALRELAHHFGNNIRENIVNPIMAYCKSIPLHAGLRFITKKYEEDLINLQAFLNDVGAEFHVLTQLDNSMTRSSIGKQAQKSLTERFAKLQLSLEDWKNRTVIRIDAEESLLTELRDINEQAELCQDALKFRLTGLTKSLADAKKLALELIDEKPNARVKEVKQWQSLMSDEYKVEANDETMFVIPKEDTEDYGVKFKCRKKDGALSVKSNAAKILKALGYYGYMKDEHLVIRELNVVGEA